MKLSVVLAVLLAGFSSALHAQHVELGVFGTYEHYDIVGPPEHEFGLGGRIGFNLGKYVQFELESSYDFKYADFDLMTLSDRIVVNNSKLGVLHGNAGLKLQTGGGSFFLFVKGGANRFDIEVVETTASGFPTVTTTAQRLQNVYTKGVLYTGGGIGFHAGVLGIRFDAGDEIYWDKGARHNLRVTFGPTLRF
jgi:hypothetical protein